VLNFFNFSSGDLGFWNTNKDKIPMLGYIIIAVVLVYLAIKKKLSIIPILGLLTNLYLITELGITNWMRFLIWLVVGLALYFTYGNKHSKLKKDIQ
jgi:hypothetical protein